MRQFTNAVIGCAVAIAVAVMAGCAPQQNPSQNSWNNSGSNVGANGTTGSGTYTPPSPAGTVAGGTVDQARSQALTDYLKAHHLPLVSGRVVAGSTGSPQVILDGYVASEFGKSDAEQKTRTFLNNPSTLVDNRITISPELAGSSPSGNGSNGNSPNGSSGTDPYASAGSVQDYQNQQQFDPYAAQQQYQYQQQGNGGSGMAMSPGLGLLLGLLGGSFGGGGVGIGGGGGGFGGGSFGGGGFGVGGGSPYSGYGYPSYPPPSSGFFP